MATSTSPTNATAATTLLSNKFPTQIKYIVGNEICERFSFYGMKAILVVFMTDYLMKSNADAKTDYHLFVQWCYFLPLLGGWLADKYLGKYKTIVWLSLVYCVGHLFLALFENQPAGFAMGLGLIALGAGGIKPCVSAHVGDQFNESNKHLLDRIFSIFYFSINFGAFFSTLLTPVLLKAYGPSVAFGVPGGLMLLATLVFMMGKKHYVHVPPVGKNGPAGYITVLFHCLRNLKSRKPGQEFFDIALSKYSRQEVEAVKAAHGIFKVFAAVTVFWALFDQQGSSWTLQAKQMDLNFLGMELDPSQIQALNPIMVMGLIPLFSGLIYPMVERMGVRVTPLRKMAVGMLLCAAAFAMVGMIQVALDSGQQLSVGWQILPYLVITVSEVMVSITGLEFAYTQAPRSMKSTIMSFWLLTVAFGNMLAAVVSQLNVFTGSGEFFFFTGLMVVISGVFIAAAMGYKIRDFVETSDEGEILANATQAG